ncbi:uncharacterized protein LOC129617192 [Condylostylus longicornis]|uniref:uncharacterized protein LOC129617192 n=1 Tax=Condylostylus longicornis TaxID=2530218 RepID=UPI00244DD18D|nr:uncharacterized protein LOC129617192 [Condylostylus longicornis]
MLFESSACEEEREVQSGYSCAQQCLLNESTGYREKRIQHSADVEELIRALGGLNLEKDYWLQTAERVKSLDASECYEGTKQFRMMLSVSGEIPIQAVIDTGVVPKLVEFISPAGDSCENPSLQFEAAWALTNIASGTGTQTEVVVGSGAIPSFIRLLDSSREDLREQGMWGLGNIAGDRADYRDAILAVPGIIQKFVDACRRSRRVSTTRTGMWSLSNLCRGKPRPKFQLVSPAVPYLSQVLHSSSDDDTLSDACWALDGLSEHPTGIATMLSHSVVPILCRLLSHRELVVQRPALRVIGQIAAGDTEQTQEVIDHGVLFNLKVLLDSPRKSIRKDACWTLSNISAGSATQLQGVLSAGVIPKLVEVFRSDNELEVKKEAAWAICNACTSRKQEHLEYLISSHCVQPVCEMLTIDDLKILEVALEALDNILEFGKQMQQLLNQPGNVCVELVKNCEGFSYLYNLHHVTQGFGSFAVWEKSGRILEQWKAHPQQSQQQLTQAW